MQPIRFVVDAQVLPDLIEGLIQTASVVLLPKMGKWLGQIFQWIRYFLQ